jgi:hypothetical protein
VEAINKRLPAMEGLKELYPILRDDYRPEGAAEGPDPTRMLSPQGMQQGGQPGMQQGGQPQQGMQLPQGGQPPQGGPQGMQPQPGMQQGGPPQPGMQLPPGGIPEQPQAPTVQQRVEAFSAYTDSEDPNIPPPQFAPTNTLPPTEQLAHNTDLVNMYDEWSSVMKSSFGSNPRDWPQRGKDILAGLHEAAIDETPPPAPEVEIPPEEQAGGDAMRRHASKWFKDNVRRAGEALGLDMKPKVYGGVGPPVDNPLWTTIAQLVEDELENPGSDSRISDVVKPDPGPGARRRFMRPTGSSELVKGLPPDGWGSHSETISVSEYQHLSELDEYPLRNSLDRMTPEQKTGLQKLAVTSQDERLVEAMESPSWLKLGADDETTQAAEQMEELVRNNVKPLSKWTKADREKFSVLHREVETAIGKFHGVDSGGPISKPAVVAKRIRAHLKQVSKWNDPGEEESKSFAQKWAENMPVD